MMNVVGFVIFVAADAFVLGFVGGIVTMMARECKKKHGHYNFLNVRG